MYVHVLWFACCFVAIVSILPLVEFVRPMTEFRRALKRALSVSIPIAIVVGESQTEKRARAWRANARAHTTISTILILLSLSQSVGRGRRFFQSHWLLAVQTRGLRKKREKKPDFSYLELNVFCIKDVLNSKRNELRKQMGFYNIAGKLNLIIF